MMCGQAACGTWAGLGVLAKQTQNVCPCPVRGPQTPGALLERLSWTLLKRLSWTFDSLTLEVLGSDVTPDGLYSEVLR